MAPGLRRSVVAQPVVEPAVDPGVVLGGQATLLPRHDVVDLALVGPKVAVRMGALKIADFNGPSGGPGEKP